MKRTKSPPLSPKTSTSPPSRSNRINQAWPSIYAQRAPPKKAPETPSSAPKRQLTAQNTSSTAPFFPLPLIRNFCFCRVSKLMMSNADVAQLDYAPAAPSRRRRRIRRVVAILFLLAIAWPVYHFGPPLWEKSKVLYYQRQCLAFTAPPDQVVYDDDPADLAVVGARRDYQVLPNKDYHAPNFPKMAAFSPGCWNDFTAAAVPNRSALGAGAVVFCHELTS